MKCGMISLGCPKNLVDTEVMLGLLKDSGYEITPRAEEADVLIINTCAFIDEAKEEAIENIFDMARFKEIGRCKGLIVTGCLSQRYSNELLHELPEVDAFVGSGEFHRIVEVVEKVLDGQRFSLRSEPDFIYDHTFSRVQTTPGHIAYIKIAEGCNNRCSYCIIPELRGRFRSRPIESILYEARALVKNGVKEIILVAQDTTRYGVDIYGEYSLARLLRQVANIDGSLWVRALYMYPTRFTDELIEVIASEPAICNYIDLPLQHIDDELLSKMRRQGRSKEIRSLIARLRTSIPDIVLRTSFIVGFPGETDEKFRSLLDFMKEVEFERVGVFKYSQEERTLAGEMPDQIDDEVKEERKNIAMEVQRLISRRHNHKRIGSVEEVLIDGRSDESPLVTVGRSKGEAPEIDGLIYIGNQHPAPGEVKRVKIIDSGDYDLVGEIVDGSLK